jgi:DNA-binding IscR family transcriptional regulator
MTWKPLKLVLDAKLPKLTPAQKLALVALARFAREDGTNIYPSIERLALNVNVSRSQMQKILRALERVGYVETVQRSKGGNFYATTLRRLNLALIARDDASPTAEALRVSAAMSEVGANPDAARLVEGFEDVLPHLRH